MKLEKLFFPLTIFASVIAVYIFFRGTGNNPQTATFPSAAGAGIIPAQTGGGQVQPITYSVPTQPVAANPLVVLSDPYNANPGGGSVATPPYMNYNLGSGNLTLPTPIEATAPTACGCGCGGACGNMCGLQNGYVDGNGNVALNTTRAQQLQKSNATAWQPQALDNLSAFLGLSDNESGNPSLTTWIPGGTLQ